MAKLKKNEIKVRFHFPIYEKGIRYEAGKEVILTKEDLKRFAKSDYEIVGKFEKKAEKKTKDIKIEDKETIDIATLE
jgi:hypothetical protein